MTPALALLLDAATVRRIVDDAHEMKRAGKRVPAAMRPAGIEDAVQNSRRYYNAVVRDLNTAVAMFPGNIVAGYGGFRPREFFELSDAGDRDVPSVKMDLT